MEKRGEGKEGIPVLALAKCLLVSFTAGLLAGKRMEKQKFLWGAFMGAAYFVILAVVSVLIRTPETALGNSFWTTMILCVAGGTLGGMLG